MRDFDDFLKANYQQDRDIFKGIDFIGLFDFVN